MMMDVSHVHLVVRIIVLHMLTAKWLFLFVFITTSISISSSISIYMNIREKLRYNRRP